MNPSTRNVARLFGRVLISWIFLFSSLGQITEFAKNVNHVTAAGMPMPQLAIITSITIQLLCGLAILVGFRIQIAAALLFLLLIPVTLVLHRFWEVSPPRAQEISFFKNMAIMGGLLFVATSNAGAYSVDALLGSDKS